MAGTAEILQSRVGDSGWNSRNPSEPGWCQWLEQRKSFRAGLVTVAGTAEILQSRVRDCGWNSGNPSEPGLCQWLEQRKCLRASLWCRRGTASSGASRTLGCWPAIILQLGYVTTLSKCARHEGQTVALTSEGHIVFFLFSFSFLFKVNEKLSVTIAVNQTCSRVPSQ